MGDEPFLWKDNEAVRAFDVAVGALPTDLENKLQGMFPFTTRFSA